jgi:hypothetical protein
VAVLHPGERNVARCHVIKAREFRRDSVGVEAALLHPQQQMFAVVGRFERGAFVDDEIVRTAADHTFDRQRCVGERGHKGIHDQ